MNNQNLDFEQEIHNNENVFAPMGDKRNLQDFDNIHENIIENDDEEDHDSDEEDNEKRKKKKKSKGNVDDQPMINEEENQNMIEDV